MQRLALNVGLRAASGKGAARKLRATGRVPAVLYGREQAPLSLSVVALELDKVVQRGANALLDLRGTREVEGKIALIKEVQRDPLRRNLLHCDLLMVDPRRPIDVEIPLHFTGKAKGIESGGVLEPLIREVEIRVLPLEIPDSIEIDVSGLEIGQSIHVRDLRLPAGAELLSDPEQTAVHVIVARMEIEAPAPAAVPAEGEAPAEGAEPVAAEAPAKT
jgi:large subunit ribosomal protein L25